MPQRSAYGGYTCNGSGDLILDATQRELSEAINAHIRLIPDYPKPGILFSDITPLLADGAAYQQALSYFVNRYSSYDIDKVVAVEARGFLFGAPLAAALGSGFIPVRKPGKLPYETIKVDYELEYGSGILEMHSDAIHAGERVLVVDDLLATGGTTSATIDLIHQLGGEVVEVAVLIELLGLQGREKLAPHPVHAVLGMP